MVLFLGLCTFLSFLGVWTVSKKDITHISRRSAEKFFLFTAFIIMVIITGCRGLNVGRDTHMYVAYFRKLDGLASLSINSGRFEFCYRLFNCLIAQVFSDAHALLFITGLVTFILLYSVFIKASEVPVYSVLMYIGLTLYYSSLTMMRQYLAIAICSIAYLFLIEKRKLMFFILVILAGLFHSSAFFVLVFLPLSMIPYQKRKRYWYILFGICGAIFFNVLIRFVIILFPKYIGYINGENYYIAGKLGSVIKAFIYGILFFVYDYIYRKYGKKTEENKIYYFCGLLGFVFSLASIQGAIISRIASYFNIMFCVSIPNALSWIPDRHKKYLWAALILAGAFSYNVIVLIFRPHWTGIIPYSFWT